MAQVQPGTFQAATNPELEADELSLISQDITSSKERILKPSVLLAWIASKVGTLTLQTVADNPSLPAIGTTNVLYLVLDDDGSGNSETYIWDGSGYQSLDEDGAVAVVGIIQDQLSSGAMIAKLERLGGAATTLNSPAAGEFDFTIASGAYIHDVRIDGNNSNLNASQEIVLRFDNSANSRDRSFTIQVFSKVNNSLVDVFATGNTPNQPTPAGNITTITIPGLNGFGAAGYYILLS